MNDRVMHKLEYTFTSYKIELTSFLSSLSFTTQITLLLASVVVLTIMIHRSEKNFK